MMSRYIGAEFTHVSPRVTSKPPLNPGCPDGGNSRERFLIASSYSRKRRANCAIVQSLGW